MRRRHPGGAGIKRVMGGLIATFGGRFRVPDFPVRGNVFPVLALLRSGVEHGACLPVHAAFPYNCS